MSRQHIRAWKRGLAQGVGMNADAQQKRLASEAALALLGRSITFGHARLAVVRLAMAVEAGAEVPTAHWSYCEEAASRCKDPRLMALWRAAADAVAARPASGGQASGGQGPWATA